MTGWTLFFAVVGIVFLTVQIFRVLDVIDRPARHPRGASAVR